MAYVVVDESGDLGFDSKKKGTSQFFVITLIFTTDIKPLRKIVKKVHRDLWHTNKKLRGTLHASEERPLTRRKLLKQLTEAEATIMAVVLNKKKVYTKLQSEKPVLYNYVTNILIDRLMNKKFFPKEKSATIIAAKRETNRFLNENFKTYVRSQVKKKHSIDIDVVIKTPSEEKALQVVDFASWAIFRKLEHADSEYAKIIAKITEESPLFP